MPTQIVLPDGFGYVPASLVSLGWLLAWQTSLVSSARSKAGIKYPQAYAEQADASARPEAMQFNCAQRAHQNTLEAVPIISISTLVLGLKYPHIAAGLCGIFTIGRIVYTLGYNTGIPRRRSTGAGISNLAMLVLAGGASYAAFLLWPWA